jgi:hypothetical protein
VTGGPGLASRRAGGRLPAGGSGAADLDLAVAPMLREVLAMGLTWRDLASSAIVVAMILGFASFELGTALVLFSSAWVASAVELALGSACAVIAAADLHTRPQALQGRIFRRVTTVLGVIALVAGLAGLAGNSGQALEILVVATVFLWLTATIWHVLSIGEES